MSDVTYVLVEVDGDMTEKEIKQLIEAADHSFFVAEMSTVTMESLEYSSPTIHFP